MNYIGTPPMAKVELAHVSGAFGVQLQTLRESRDVELAAFARALGLTRPYVWQVEHGVRAPFSLVHLTRVRRLLTLTNTEYADLLYLAAREHVVGVRTSDFTKPREALRLLALLATYDQHLPPNFFAKIFDWIEEHCK